MYITSKRYTKEGRSRFGSAIFINDLKEERVDTLKGTQIDTTILVAITILVILKILSANILGLLITIPIYTIMYYYGVKVTKLTYTSHRILIEKEYRHHIITKIIAGFLSGITFYLISSLLFPSIRDDLEFRISGMTKIFQFLNLYDSRFFAYRNFISDNYAIVSFFDSIFTILISSWFIMQFYNINFQFTEVNLNHISEQFTKVKSVTSLPYLLFMGSLYLLIHFLFFQRFSLLFLISFLIIFQLIPREKHLHFSLIGPSSRNLVKNVILDQSQLSNLSRTTAITFGWLPQRRQGSRGFPEKIIPEEVVSTYETGLRAYSKRAYRQSNILGATLSTITNIVIIIVLLQFVIVRDLDEYDTVFFIFTLLVGISILTFIGFEVLNQFRQQSKMNEKLLIGEGFISRSTSGSIWILRGSSLEGTTIQRGKGRSLVRFDKTRGLIVEWERFTVLFVIFGFISILGVWASLGAVNLQALPLVFPELVDFGLEFIEQKARAELEFFMIAGYVLWAVVILVYPRYYARTRPSLFLDMEYASVEPIVLKDYKEHQHASLQFTKSLIKSSENHRRLQQVRPGTFLVDIDVSGLIGEGKKVRFYIGDNLQMREVEVPISDQKIFKNVVISGLKGYPETNLIVELLNQRGDVLYSNSTHIAILYGKFYHDQLDLGIFGSIDLYATIVKQKS